MGGSLFDWDPENYDRARPSYPDALFDDLWAYLDEGTRAHPATIEVGPGTGQATRALLGRRARVMAVELGPRLAAFLARRFLAQPELTVLNAAFEDVPLSEGAWDLVFSATAYHWVASEARMAKPHALLKAGGVLAVVDTIQVRDEADRGYFERSQPLYARYWPDQATFHPAPQPDVEPPILEEMRASGLFEDVRLWRYRWDQRYDVDAYISLVRSYSNTYELAPDLREVFLADLRAFVKAERVRTAPPGDHVGRGSTEVDRPPVVPWLLRALPTLLYNQAARAVFRRLPKDQTMKTTPLATLLACFVLALPTPGGTQDSPKDKTAPGETKPTTPKEVLKSMVGSWEGTCRTWFQPGKLADESRVKGEIRPILDGRLVRHTYDGMMLGKPRHGEETIVFSSMAKRFQVSWLDGFHMRDGILFSEGEATPRGFTVTGKYDAPSGPPWGWKTVFDLVDDDHLTITAYNIKPDGQEGKAVETQYTRAKP